MPAGHHVGASDKAEWRRWRVTEVEGVEPIINSETFELLTRQTQREANHLKPMFVVGALPHAGAATCRALLSFNLNSGSALCGLQLPTIFEFLITTLSQRALGPPPSSFEFERTTLSTLALACP